MTEKRFKVVVYDDKSINGFAVLDLQKPNSSKRLKYENVYIGSKEGCEIVCKFGNSLAEETLQLKIQLQNISRQRDEFYRGARENANRVGKLEKENKQLKKELSIYRKLASCRNCKYHTYDWYDDGDEFEVCEKKNDMRYGICKEWEEFE